MEVSLEGIPDLARDVVARLPNVAGSAAHVIGLKGELGAGKTTFVQAIAKELGVKESVTSPTFVIAQAYATTHPVFKKLVHMDAYRLTPGEPDTFGLTAALADPTALVLIEWSERVEHLLPNGYPVITFETVDETTRRVIGV